MVYTEEPNPAILDRSAAVEVRPLGGAGGEGARARRHCALWRVCAAEAAGAALLVALTCLPGCAAGAAGAADPAPLAQRALAGGLCVAALVQCFDHVSGAHFNPTVTLAALLAGRVPLAHAALVLPAQLAGALAGAAGVRALAPGGVARCVTRPAAELGELGALCVETLLGGVLALVNLAAWDARVAHYKDSWPLRIGLSVAALTFAAGDLTGASMNPVRSAAPALLAGDARALWVYCVGPPCGACVSAALYACAWRASPRPDAPPRRKSPQPA